MNTRSTTSDATGTLTSTSSSAEAHVRWFEDLSSGDVSSVGGKNASLGEMIRALSARGIRVPGGFAVTAAAYRAFLRHNELEDMLRETMDAFHDDELSLEEVGEKIRGAIGGGEFPPEVERAIRDGYEELSGRYEVEEADVAVRSSATAEDLPEASFAGQQESFLNVRGADALLRACRRCFASLFTDRAISYREQKGFGHLEIALSVGVQKMVRSDLAGAGVMFSIDTETGFPDMVVIDASWGLGEKVVQGSVNPDEYRVFKPLLERDDVAPVVEKTLGAKETKIVYGEEGKETREAETSREERRSYVLNDEQILRLARWARDIEDHYGRPMDIEWALDGEREELFIVQARPETVQSRELSGSLKTYTITGERGEKLAEGAAIGRSIASGEAFVLRDLDGAERFEEGGILVTDMTDPDWVPVMRKAAGIVTDRGGRTSHAAIVSRELGVPAVVGTESATSAIEDGDTITVSCAEGETGFVYAGELEFEAEEMDLEDVPETRTRIMMNLGDPGSALNWWRLPADGVGLARMEFIISDQIQVHPMALVRFDELEDEEVRERIEELTLGYEDKCEYFVDHLARGIAKIAASQYPEPVVVRTSDFKTNEYAQLIGGRAFEPEEANPMLGFRGASRYYNERYREGFALECRALRRVRERIGLDNVIVMIPFCRTVAEADRVLEVMAEHGLERGVAGLEVYMMCEIPSNVVLAKEFARRFDGFSIGSNDLTQLTLGVDRDSAVLSGLFDERDEAVKEMIRRLIPEAHEAGGYVGICGQAPSDHPDFAEFLVGLGIDSISLNPDSVLDVRRRVAEMEKRLREEGN